MKTTGTLLLMITLAATMAGRAQEAIATDNEIWRCLSEGDSSDTFLWRSHWINSRGAITMEEAFSDIGPDAVLLREEEDTLEYRWHYLKRGELHRLDVRYMGKLDSLAIVDQFTLYNLTDSCTAYFGTPFIPDSTQLEIDVMFWAPDITGTKLRQTKVFIKNTLDFDITSVRGNILLKEGDEVVFREPYTWEGRLIPNAFEMVSPAVLEQYEVGRALNTDTFSMEIELEEVLPKPDYPPCDVYHELTGE